MAELAQGSISSTCFCAAFTPADLKVQKAASVQGFLLFCTFGASVGVKAVPKMMVKLTLDFVQFPTNVYE